MSLKPEQNTRKVDTRSTALCRILNPVSTQQQSYLTWNDDNRLMIPPELPDGCILVSLGFGV